MAPSNSGPLPVLTVVGEKAFQTMDSQIFVATVELSAYFRAGCRCIILTEKGNTAAETVSLLEELIKQDDNHRGSKELDNEEDTDTGTEVGGLAVETGKDGNAGLTERQDDSEKLCVVR